MADVSFKKFSELAVTTTLIAADIIPVVTVTGGNNSKQITYNSFAQTVSSTLIGPFTNTITAITPASADKWNSAYTTVNANSASWGAVESTNGLTIFKQVSSIASPNFDTTVHALDIISSKSNVDIALLSKGNGATLAQIPDGGSTGGSKRGQYVTDLQKIRDSNIQVASGNYSVIGGGASNTASGFTSIVVGGSANTASGVYSAINGGLSSVASSQSTTIGGGEYNTASGIYSTVAGGNLNKANASNGGSTVGGGANNTASGQYSIIAGGWSNRALSSYSTIAGGFGNEASGIYSTTGGGRQNYTLSSYSTVAGGAYNYATGYGASIAGGTYNIASGDYSTVIGNNGTATLPGQIVFGGTAYGGGQYSGDAQFSTFLLSQTTTSAVSSTCVLTSSLLSGPGSEITLSANETMFLTATVSCLSSQENATSYFSVIKGIAKCNAAGNVTIYNQTADANAIRIPNAGTFLTTNAGFSAAGNKLRVIVFVPGVQTFRWNVKLEALSIKGLF